MQLELFARNSVITLLGVGAGWISLGHVYTFVMVNSPTGTHWTTGTIVAAVSELMPIGVALHYRITRKLGPFAVFLLLLAGGFSLWAQIATAKPGVAGYAVAAFTTLAFMGLVKLILGKTEDRAEPHAVVQSSPVPATPAWVATSPAITGAGEGSAAIGTATRPATSRDAFHKGRELGTGSAGGTGEAPAEPVVKVSTPKAPAKPGSRSAATRAEKIEKVKDALTELREKSEKVSQAEIARKTGISQATVSRIMSQLDPVSA